MAEDPLRTHDELRPFVLSKVRFTGIRIGSGAYGSVEEVALPGAICAAKKIHDFFQDDRDFPENELHRSSTQFVMECRLMSTLRHPHIVQFLGVCFFPGSRLPALVMERLLTSLHDLLDPEDRDTPRSDAKPFFPLSLKESILHDVASGLTYLHEHTPPVIHRDLSARNVLLNSGMVAKIADLGVARIVSRRAAATMTKAPGASIYMPPEALENRSGGEKDRDRRSKYDASIDVFSFGVVSIFTVSQVFPCDLLAPTYRDGHRLTARTELERREQYMRIIYGQLRENHPLIQIIERCLDFPENRPSIRDVLYLLEQAKAEDRDDQIEMSKLDLMRALRTQPMNQPLDPDVQVSLEEVQQQLRSSEAEKQTLRQQLTRKEAVLSRAEETIRREQQRNLQMEYQNFSTAQLSSNETALDETHRRVEELKQMVVEKNELLQEKERELDEKEEEISQLTQEVADKNELVQDLGHHISQLQTQQMERPYPQQRYSVQQNPNLATPSIEVPELVQDLNQAHDISQMQTQQAQQIEQPHIEVRYSVHDDPSLSTTPLPTQPRFHDNTRPSLDPIQEPSLLQTGAQSCGICPEIQGYQLYTALSVKKTTKGKTLSITLEIDINEIQFDDPIGEGGSGVVFRGVWKSKRINVALKKVRIPPEHCDAKILGELGEHPNLISFFGFVRDDLGTTVVTALATNGSLFNYLHKDKKVPSLQQSLQWAKQISYGVAHIHKLGLVHRDLKSSNILFTNGMEAQICDFGHSRPMKNSTYASKVAGTWRWMAPEVANEDVISKMCDVFSFSMVVWELMEHKVPFHESTDFKASMKIIEGERPPISPLWPRFLADLTEAGWSADPHDRPSFPEIVTSLENNVYFRR